MVVIIAPWTRLCLELVPRLNDVWRSISENVSQVTLEQLIKSTQIDDIATIVRSNPALVTSEEGDSDSTIARARAAVMARLLHEVRVEYVDGRVEDFTFREASGTMNGPYGDYRLVYLGVVMVSFYSSEPDHAQLLRSFIHELETVSVVRRASSA